MGTEWLGEPWGHFATRHEICFGVKTCSNHCGPSKGEGQESVGLGHGAGEGELWLDLCSAKRENWVGQVIKGRMVALRRD